MKVLDMHCDTITRLYEEYPNESLLENTGHIDLKKMQKGDYLLQNLRCLPISEIHRSLF